MKNTILFATALIMVLGMGFLQAQIIDIDLANSQFSQSNSDTFQQIDFISIAKSSQLGRTL